MPASTPSFTSSILAVEVSSNQASVAWSQEGFKGNLDFNNTRHIEAQLSSHIQQAIEQLTQPPSLVLIGLGPGSYSSCRVAIASAICLGLWHDCPVIGLHSTLATHAKEHEISTLVGNARRGQYFSWHMQQGSLHGEPVFYTQPEIKYQLQSVTTPIYSFDKSDTSNELSSIHVELLTPQALELIHYWHSLNQKQQEELIQQASNSTLEPIYLRSAQITPAKSHTTRQKINDRN